jgi:hypothetical protein
MNPSSTIIEDLKRICAQTTNYVLTYFYFTYREPQTKTAISCLSSLLRQLCANSDIPESLQRLYRTWEERLTNPSVNDIKASLASLIREQGQVFIVIDALDECPDDPDKLQRAEILKWIIETLSQSPNAHILFTSRNDLRSLDIADAVGPLPGMVQVQVDSARNSSDIQLYLSHQFESNSALQELKIRSKIDIQDFLFEQSHGM